MRRKFWALLICRYVLLTDPNFPPQSKLWNRISLSRASKISCRISHIIKKSINSWSISDTAYNKSPKMGWSCSVREISTLPPKPRAEGSNPSAPAIVKGACKRLKFGICGLFLCQNCPIGHALKIPDFRGKILQMPQYSWIFQRLPSGTSSKKHQLIFGKGRSCTVCRGCFYESLCL